MANLFDDSKRNIIPNWRSFGTTTSLGELNSLGQHKDEIVNKYSLKKYIIDFEINKAVPHAADLISAAVVNNQIENRYVKNAANFILKNKTKATISQLLLAEQILNNQEPVIGTLETKLSEFTPTKYYQLIRETKSFLREYPSNAILQVELSRYYSIIGQEYKSVEAMIKALHLAKNNRFVLRSATRLFTHYHSEDNEYLKYIRGILNASKATAVDPWLMSAEISISTAMERNSKFIKKGIALIDSKNLSPFNFTELASSIATVEMQNGKAKKSRDLFKKSIICPNDNSLAQFEWASRTDKSIKVDHLDFDVQSNYEVLAQENYFKNNFSESFKFTVKWFIDQPFSIRSAIFGSYLASTVMKDQEKSISLIKAGLISNPGDPTLLNNFAYSLALQNKPAEALNELSKIKYTFLEPSTETCIKATRGLIAFRSGNIDQGRYLYWEAISDAKKADNKLLNWTAILNYAREEISNSTREVESIMDIVSKIPDNKSEIAISILKADIIDMYKKMKK